MDTATPVCRLAGYVRSKLQVGGGCMVQKRKEKTASEVLLFHTPAFARLLWYSTPSDLTGRAMGSLGRGRGIRAGNGLRTRLH